jgi:signal transduction histidine kinase
VRAIDAVNEYSEHTLLYFLEDPVVVLSKKGAVVYVNPAFRDRFKVERKEVTGIPFSEKFPDWVCEPVVERLRTLEPEGGAHNFWIKNGNERFRVSMAGITLKDRVAGAVVTLWDASREMDLKVQNLELFRAMLDDLSAPVDEIKSIFPEMADQSKGFRDEAKSRLDHLEEGLSRFRDFSELLLGEVRTERVPFSPNRLISLVRKSLRPLAEQRQVYLEEGLSRELPRLLGDPALLNRVLGLMVDYMIRVVPPNEMVVVTADLLLMNTGSPWLAYSATGTGPVSLETELLDKKSQVAEAFSNLSDERKRLLLRLFLSRRLVNAMGGVISTAADKLAGATISIRVPVEIHFTAES